MSMNLRLQDNNAQFDLWQTPTFITYMCVQGRDTELEDIKERYFLWVDSHTNGSWEEGELEVMVDRVKEHKQEVNDFILLATSGDRDPDFFVC